MMHYYFEQSYLSKYLDKHCRPRSDCSAPKQYDQGLHCLLLWQTLYKYQCNPFITHSIRIQIWILHGHVGAPKIFYHGILQRIYRKIYCKIVLLQHNSYTTGSISMEPQKLHYKGTDCTDILNSLTWQNTFKTLQTKIRLLCSYAVWSGP